MPPKFFRKEALEKLSTPEKLDQLIEVTHPHSWITLLTIILILVTGVAWGFLGTTKTKVESAGIIMSGEVFNVVATTSGQLVELTVQLNEEVQAGQVVALVEQPEITQQIQESEASKVEKEIQLAQLTQFGIEENRVQAQLIEEQKNSLEDKITTNRQRINYLKEQLDAENQLLTQGLITKAQVEQTRQQITAIRNENKSLKAKITQTLGQQLNMKNSLSQKLSGLEQRIAQDRRRIAQLREQYRLRHQIVSQHTGKVLEIMTEKGLVVSPGTPLIRLGTDLENTTENLRAVLFISSKDGKKVKEGMEALIAPSTVKPQEYGYMIGKVTYISDFPATQQGMMNVLKNDQLVRQMLSLGAPFEAHIQFAKKPNTTTEYVWTSKEGPPIEIFSGTLCSGRLTVQQQTPVSIVLPALKEFFDLY
ncbi:MAG: NHLP bacteriocin system secretion protein [Bacteroidota bacterium]